MKRQDAGATSRQVVGAAPFFARLFAPLLPSLIACALAGCSGFDPPPQAAPAAGPDASYNTLVANQIKSLFKGAASYQAFEISGYRWVQGMKGWSWRSCVRFRDHGHPRTYVLFIQDGVVVDNRYAVETDRCARETYAPFDAAIGPQYPADFGIRQPIY